MVCVTFSASHCSRYAKVLEITLPADDVVNLVPVLGPWVHPGSLVSNRLAEGYVEHKETTAVYHLSSPYQFRVCRLY